MAASQAAEDPSQNAGAPAPTSSSPVEMSELQSTAGAEQRDTSPKSQRIETDTSPPHPSEQQDISTPLPSTDTPVKPTPIRKQSEALGPATDSPISPPTTSAGPTLSITLMLTTGARHPYKIDEKYLKNRSVDTPSMINEGSFDPREISGYKLKELIWTDWRNEWEARPASPSSIRLIILGRLLEDKSPLKDFPFKLDDTNVVHMTVKPADFLDDEEMAGKGTGKGHSIRGRDGEDRGAGCRCVIL